MDEPTTQEDTEALRRAVSKVYHDLNNPLSIISGNAQFLLEITRDEEMDPHLVQSIKDIQEAANQMADSLSMLTELKEKL